MIGNTPAITAVVVTPVDASCGLSNGSVTIGAVTGGTAPYTYSFNGGAYGAATKLPEPRRWYLYDQQWKKMQTDVFSMHRMQ